MFCKNCGGPLTPGAEMLNSDDPYYRGAARCPNCNFLYFPDYAGTWNPEGWMADFDRKANVILQQSYDKNDWRRDAHLAVHFIDCLGQMVTRYFRSSQFDEHERLLEILSSVGAVESVDTLRQIVQLARRPDQVLERFGLVGDTSENVDDAWEEVTAELERRLDPDLRERIYDRFMRGHDLAELTADPLSSERPASTSH